MNLPVEYSWIESFIDNDFIFLEGSINWEDAFRVALYDVTLYSILATPFFNWNFFFLDSQVKLSFIDIIFFFESDSDHFSRELYDLFIWDIAQNFFSKYLPSQFLFYTDYQDHVSLLLNYSPELIIILDSYITKYILSKFFEYTPSVVYDLFNDSVVSALSEFLDYFALFLVFSAMAVVLLSTFNINKWSNANDSYWARFFYYSYSLTKETRLQFEAMLQTLFFFIFYWSMLISTFDDDQEEVIELFDSIFFIFFCGLVSFLIFKYSQHYFAFLETSVSEGKSVSFIAKQLFRDFINTFALMLRFFILLFRLNIYDTLDDFYDSYYIFVGDFDDDEYFSEIFVSFTSFYFYDLDNKDDRSFSLEDETDFVLDFFYLYFICWAKLYLFIFFILEEILRIGLAFYICYLIIFEVHAVNCSYLEDNYFLTKRQKENINKSFL